MLSRITSWRSLTVAQSVGREPAVWRNDVDAEIIARVRAFVAQRITPEAGRLDELDLYPREIIKGLAGLGCNAITLSRKHGGAGDTYATAARMIEEVGYGSAAVAISL